MTYSANYREIIAHCPALIDVRAPVEFMGGSFTNGVNCPLLDDHQRHEVGSCYRQSGKEAAFKLATQLLKGGAKKQRIELWSRVISDHPDANLICYRGGMRSTVAQRWLREETNVEVVRVAGGYKALRNYILHYFAAYQPDYKPLLLGGYTGAGKTEMIRTFPWSIDLELLAHHRGSAFGAHSTPQPSQASFENHLGAELIRYDEHNYPILVIEDEGKHIGRRFLPKAISENFAGAPLIIVDEPLSGRLDRLFSEYVTIGQRTFLERVDHREGVERWCALMKENCRKIGKRLGSKRLGELLSLLEQAEEAQIRTGITQDHRFWLEYLVTNYYDPMYDYQIASSEKTILFRGDRTAVAEYLTSLAVDPMKR